MVECKKLSLQNEINDMGLKGYKKEMINFLLEKSFNPEEYKQTLKNLKYLKNKSDFTDSKNSFPISNGLFLLLENIEKDGYPYWIDRYGHVMTVSLPDKNKIIIQGDYGFNDSVLRKIFSDKNYTTQILRNNGVTVPEEILLMKQNDIYCDYGDRYENHILGEVEKLGGFPLIAKPIDQSLGKGVEKILDQEGLIEFLEYFNNKQQFSNLYVIQKFVEGNDHRILYLDGNVIIAYKRDIVSILGDGERSIFDILKKGDFSLDHKIAIEKYLKIRKIKDPIAAELRGIRELLF